MRRTAAGASILMAAQAVQLAAQLASLIVLARLLPPSAFGLVAMVSAVVGLAGVLGGFGLSLSALSGTPPTKSERSGLFWLNAAAGAIASVIVAALGPLLALFYRQPALTAVTLALSATFLLNALAVQFKVELNLASEWVRLAATQAAPPFVGLVAASAVAVLTHSYWALIVQALVVSAVQLSLAVALCAWRPHWPRRDTSMRRHLVFGRDTLIVQALNYAVSNADNVLVGKVLGARVLGFYSRAYSIALLPLSQIAIPLEQVVLPRLSASAEDFDKATLMCQRIVVYAQLLPISLLAGSADPLIRVCLGVRWLPTASLIQIQAIGAAASGVGYIFWWVLLVKRRTTVLALSEGLIEILTIAAMVIFVTDGSHAVAWCVTLGQIAIVPASAFLCRRTVGLDILGLLRASSGGLVITGAAACAAAVAAHRASVHPVLALIASVLSWSATLVVALLVSKSARRDARLLWRAVVSRPAAVKPSPVRDE